MSKNKNDTKVKISISGGSLNGNSGAEAMLITTIRRLESEIPECEFGIFTPYYNDDKLIWINEKYPTIYLFNSSPISLVTKLFTLSVLAGGLKKIRIKFLKYLFPKSIQFLWESSVFIDVAGVSFIDSRLKFVPFNVLSIYPAFLLNIPVVKFAQATGPYKKILNRVLAKHCLKKVNHTFARGITTELHLKELKLAAEKFSLSTDIVFCNQTNDSLTDNYPDLQDFISQINTLKTKTKGVIGLCPSSVVFNLSKKQGGDHISLLLGISKRILNEGYTLVIYPNATKEHKPSNFIANDIPVIVELVKELKKEQVGKNYLFYDRNINTTGIKQIINTLDITVVSRFHSMIFSLSLATPVFILGWSHKYSEVMKAFGLEKYVYDYKNADVKLLFESINEILKEKINIENKIKKRLKSIQELSFRQIDYVLNLIKE